MLHIFFTGAMVVPPGIRPLGVERFLRSFHFFIARDVLSAYDIFFFCFSVSFFRNRSSDHLVNSFF